MPFQVIGEASLAKEAGKYETIIIDTKGRPERDDLNDMIVGSDLIVVPCPPDAQAVATLRMLFAQFKTMDATNYRVLLVNVPPAPQKDGEEYLALLAPCRGLQSTKSWEIAGRGLAGATTRTLGTRSTRFWRNATCVP